MALLLVRTTERRLNPREPRRRDGFIAYTPAIRIAWPSIPTGYVLGGTLSRLFIYPNAMNYPAEGGGLQVDAAHAGASKSRSHFRKVFCIDLMPLSRFSDVNFCPGKFSRGQLLLLRGDNLRGNRLEVLAQ